MWMKHEGRPAEGDHEEIVATGGVTETTPEAFNTTWKGLGWVECENPEATPADEILDHEGHARAEEEAARLAAEGSGDHQGSDKDGESPVKPDGDPSDSQKPDASSETGTEKKRK